MLRIGQGYDVHRLVEDRDLWICGVKIPHSHGLLGHSDADVAIHALCDALLGALALGDIGKHFPDSDPRYKGIDSKILLGNVMKLVNDQGYRLCNCDITICAEAPKFRPYIDLMRETLADVMNVSPSQVSVKATTTEKLGFTGRREGIASMAVCLLTKCNP
ncbi:MAG: 2-C-methyl-D-erythritol 2,4-cyclodiphosphate synthase [Muribaculaceae bacterium]|nr:2-C-methyl-D-erythritol 2,4-cyclodiphosphate synthase [Muribaculaceae bacterium]